MKKNVVCLSAILCWMLGISTQGQTLLGNGQVINELYGETGDEKSYVITVPSGTTKIEFKIWGGSGDCDIYVRYGLMPTVSDYDHRPFTTHNDETITVNDPQPGNWYIMLRGYTPYSGVSFSVSYWTAETTAVVLQNGVSRIGLSGGAGSAQYFSILVPSGRTVLQVKTSGGTGDADLYVRVGALPTTDLYNSRSTSGSNTETVTIQSPASGIWYILVQGYSAYSGLTLTATHSSTPPKVAVLIHGRTDTPVGYWAQLPSLLVSQGYQVHEFQWDKKTGGFLTKASDLYTFINDTGASSVRVVAHSLGVLVFREAIRQYSSLRPKIAKAVLMAGPSYGVDLDGPAAWWNGMSETIKNQIKPGSSFIWSLHNGGSILESSKVLQILGGKNYTGKPTYGNADGLVAGISARLPGFQKERIVNHNHSQMISKITAASAQSYSLIYKFFEGRALGASYVTPAYKGGGVMAKCKSTAGASLTDASVKIRNASKTHTLVKNSGNSYVSDQDWGQTSPIKQPVDAGLYMAVRKSSTYRGAMIFNVTVRDGYMTVLNPVTCY